jgi:SAM-dependent methyltransferase
MSDEPWHDVSMHDELNPQAHQMSDESMVRNLAAQASAIWPQELPLFGRYGLAGPIQILDAGCGTGEITSRLADLYPEASLLGVDIVDAHLERARDRCRRHGARVRFEPRSVFATELPDETFDLVVCRHLIQAVPHPERVLTELARITKRGGRLHLIAEDYGMIHFPDRQFDADELWHDGAIAFGRALNCDLRIGRRAPGLLQGMGLRDVTVDYVTVDTLRVPRKTFAAIWQAWRDGYASDVAANSRFSQAEIEARFDDMIATLGDPAAYALWQLPVVTAVR